MKHDFLKAFPRRMKHVGLYALLIANSGQKQKWNEMGFREEAEQLNMDFAVLLFIMEQSLREEPCTLDEVATFIDSLNPCFFEKKLTWNECYELGSFVVNRVLSNEGVPMSFRAFDFEEEQTRELAVSYVTNRIVYLGDSEVPRTSYSLSDDGYSLVLGTLEIEDNMKFDVQELIFRLHLEKRNYEQALVDVKGLFNLMHVQLKRNEEAMASIRRNVLSYSVDEYDTLLRGNMKTINETLEKLNGFRETVRTRRREMEQGSITAERMGQEERDQLGNIREIERYLSRAIDEHQRIFRAHMDVKSAYVSELDKVQNMALVERFSLRRDLYEKVLQNPETVGRLGLFFSPLLQHDPAKTLNLNRVFEPQRMRQDEESEEPVEVLVMDAEEWEEQQKRERQEKMDRYRVCLTALLEALIRKGRIDLADLGKLAQADAVFASRLLPSVVVFKEVFIELVRLRNFNIAELKAEQTKSVEEDTGDVLISRMLLSILGEHPEWQGILEIQVTRLPEEEPVLFENVPDEYGTLRTIRCSNIRFTVTMGRAV